MFPLSKWCLLKKIYLILVKSDKRHGFDQKKYYNQLRVDVETNISTLGCKKTRNFSKKTDPQFLVSRLILA